MEMPSNLSPKIFQIAVFKCCAAPLDELDLSFLNLKFYKMQDLEDHVSSLAGESGLSQFKISYQEWMAKWNPDYLIALCAIDIDTPFQKKGLFDDIQRILLLLFPSEFRHYSLIGFRVYEQNSVFLGEDQVTVSPNRQREMEHPLIFDRNLIPDIEKFVHLYFKKPIPGYLRLCIDNYTAHYFQWKKSIGYLSLSICMESISEGKEMVMYKIRRNLSIINGKTKEESEAIFNNTKNVYDLRSKIVHGEQFNDSDIDVYLPYLRQLIACTIIELLVHGINEREELNERINSLGFGQKTQLSELYDAHLPNSFCHLKMDRLPKLSKT